jgi:type I restriction enzyme, R subunit
MSEIMTLQNKDHSKTTGTDIDRILPPVSRFSGARAVKKQSIIEKLIKFFERYLGLVQG